jgi:hypothetical protein
MLVIAGKPIENQFQLIGLTEDSITRAFAWGLSKSPSFMACLLRRAEVSVGSRIADVRLSIHRYEENGGITDLEIILPNEFHLVVEAKKGWILPGEDQLLRYAARESFRNHLAPIKKILTLSECSAQYAEEKLPRKLLDEIPVKHISWENLVSDAMASRKSATNAEKRMLEELVAYIGGFVTQQKQSNLVYVVSLGSGSPDNWSISWIDIVNKHFRYFHPVHGKWPKTPPTYLGFRYGGRLQTIHFVKSYQVVDDLAVGFLGQPSQKAEPHYLYELGPAIVPPRAVVTGSIYPSGRVWCAIDALLTCDSVSDARDLTQRRIDVA